jgi:hypothetical protein
MESLLSSKKNDILTHAKIWIVLEKNNIKVKKPDRKAIECVTLFIWSVQNNQCTLLVSRG